MDTAAISATLKEVAEAIDAESIVSFEDPERWILGFADDYPLLLSPLARGDHWVLSGPLAELPEAHQHQIFDLMMLYNGQAEQTGGFAIGLDEPAPDGMLKLSLLIGPSDLAPPDLTRIITRFRLCRRTWGEVIEGWSPEGPPEAAQQRLFLPNQRV